MEAGSFDAFKWCCSGGSNRIKMDRSVCLRWNCSVIFCDHISGIWDGSSTGTKWNVRKNGGCLFKQGVCCVRGCVSLHPGSYLRCFVSFLWEWEMGMFFKQCGTTNFSCFITMKRQYLTIRIPQSGMSGHGSNDRFWMHIRPLSQAKSVLFQPLVIQ